MPQEACAAACLPLCCGCATVHLTVTPTAGGRVPGAREGPLRVELLPGAVSLDSGCHVGVGGAWSALCKRLQTREPTSVVGIGWRSYPCLTSDLSASVWLG